MEKAKAEPERLAFTCQIPNFNCWIRSVRSHAMRGRAQMNMDRHGYPGGAAATAPPHPGKGNHLTKRSTMLTKCR